MKNIFGFDLAAGEYCGKELIIRKTDCKITEHQEKTVVRTIKAEKHKRFPLWLSIVQYLCAFTVILVVFTSVMDVDELDFKEMFAAAPWKYIVAVIAAVGWLAIFIAAQVHGRMAEKAPAFRDVFKVIEAEVHDKSYERLKIPADAGVIDVLSLSENTQNFQKPSKRPLYFCVEIRIFKDGKNLYLSDLECVMAIPLEEITGAARLGGTFRLGNWTKNEEYTEEKFKRFGVRRNRAGEYFVKACCAVKIDHCGEPLEFIVPSYDFATLERYTGSI